MYENHWTKEQHDKWIDELTEIYKNIYQTGPEESRNAAEWWTFLYGMTVEGENLLTE